jgi:Uma2 family endonuclease
MSVRVLIGEKEISPPFSVHKPFVSEEEYLKITDEDSRCELIFGELIMNSPASTIHEEIFRFVLSLLSFYVEEKDIGTVLGANTAIHFRKNLILIPDLIFIARKREEIIKDTFIEGSPDLVMEILSETTRENDLGRKLEIYKEYLVREVWIIDPEEKTVQIHKLLKRGYRTRGAKGGILNSGVIAGFFVNPEWLFISSRPKIRECFEKILASNEPL